MRSLLLASALVGLSTVLTAQSPLTTLFNQNNGGSAGWTMYFDLQVNVPIVLTQFDVNLNSGTTGTLDVYTCASTYVGNASSTAPWTLGGSGSVTNAGTNLPSTCPISPIPLAPGNYGIAIVHNGVGPAYTNGNGTTTPGSGTNQTYTALEVTVLAGASGSGGLGTGICCEPRVINMNMHWTTGSGTIATRTNYGTGCYDAYSTFQETFGAGGFDLSNSSILMQPTGAGGYVVLPGSGAWFTPTSANLGLTDDSVSAPQNLPLPLTTPGGTTSQVWIASNGCIWTAANTNNGCCAGDPLLLVQNAERFAPLWQDLNPGVGGTVHFDVDAASATAYVTWLNVPEYGNSTTNTFQVAFMPGGLIEYRWQTCSNVTHTALVGYSPGNNARNRPSIDLSTSLPITTAADHIGIKLNASARPVINTTLNLVTSDIPAGTTIGATVLSFTPVNPGVNLGVIGAPDCFQYVNPAVVQVFVVSGSTGQTSMTIPNNPSFSGAHVYAQGATFTTGLNALGVLTTNGVDLMVGTL